MQKILVVLTETLRKTVVMVCLLSLLSFSSLFVWQMPVSAATSTINQRTAATQKVNAAEVERRGDAYEELVKEAQSPTGIEKVYEENLKEYREENPEESLLEKAEELVEKVTNPEEKK